MIPLLLQINLQYMILLYLLLLTVMDCNCQSTTVAGIYVNYGHGKCMLKEETSC